MLLLLLGLELQHQQQLSLHHVTATKKVNNKWLQHENNNKLAWYKHHCCYTIGCSNQTEKWQCCTAFLLV